LGDAVMQIVFGAIPAVQQPATDRVRTRLGMAIVSLFARFPLGIPRS